ncbi:MAG: hypothetical protein RMH84_00275, partial [Sulfolobales archaeon]|nr:hypothetical protein [Sulfolobales archaeon]
GGDVYPGSASARISIGVRYLGSETAYFITGCLDLPPGFSARYRCSGARGVDGSYVIPADYGEMIYFEYLVDVDKAVTPGVHTIALNISGRVGTSIVSDRLVFDVEVSQYPDLKVELLEAYWSPEAYPGTADAAIFMVFELGEVGIESAQVTLELPEGFYPRTIRRSVGAASRYSTFTLVVPGIDVDRELSAGVYRANVTIEARAVTADRVVYSASTKVQVPIEVGTPPPLKLRIVSSEWRGPRAPSGSKALEYLVVLRLEDPVTISSIVAKLALPDCAESASGSRELIAYLVRPVNYGEVLELVFSGISLACAHTTSADLLLEVLVNRDGSEFWTTLRYRVFMVVHNPSIDARVVSAFWSPGPAYPGSSGLSLVVVIENYDYVSLFDGVVKMVLDTVEPRETTLSGISVESLGRATVVFQGLSVPRSVAPGTYRLKLALNSLARSGRSVYVLSMEFDLPINIGEPPLPRLEIVSYGWVDGGAFSRSIDNALRVIVRNSDPSVLVRGLKATLELPDCFSVGNLGKTFTSSAAIPYGSTITLEYPGVDIACGAGIYRAALLLEVLGEISGSTFWQNLVYDLVVEVEDSALNVAVVDAGWTSGVAYGNATRLVPYVVLVSYTRDSLLYTYVRARVVNARFSEGPSEAAVSVRETVPYGSSFTVRLPTVEVEGVRDSVVLELSVDAVVRYGRTTYNASRELKVSIPVVYEKNLALSWFQAEYGGAPSPLLPTARDVRVVATLTNLRPESLSISRIRVEVPEILRVMGVEGDCLRATLVSGGSCGLGVVLYVREDAEPSTHTIRIGIDYIKQAAGAALYGFENLSIPIVVDSLENYVPEVRVVRTFWGLQQPSPAHPGSRYVPVTVVLQNLGRYDAVGLTVRAQSTSLVPVVAAAECATRLLPGSSCSTALYFDVPGSTEGYVRLEMELEYYVTAFGTHARVLKKHSAQLYVEPAATFGGSLRPVSWGWLNNYNIFPETENATFVITVANRLPHSVVGVFAELYLPKDFRGSRGEISTTYLDGPLRSYSSAPLSFRVSVGRVKPGSYRAIARLDYVVLSGGPGVRYFEEHEVDIVVVDDREAVELVSASWIEGSAEPGTYGAILHVVVRNRFVDGMTGVFLELLLPNGFSSSVDNSSTARVPPISQQVLRGMMSAGAPQLSNLAQLLQSAAAPRSLFNRGEMIDFLVPLNVLVNATGRYTASAVLHYVDSWGTPRRCEFRIPLTVLGGVRYIEAYIDGGVVRISSKFTKASLKIRNVGSGPAYNVYIAILPYAQLPVILASPSVRYIDRLDPNREEQIVLTLAYNPMGVFAAGVQSVVSYGTVPLVVGVVYRDAGGRLKMFNTSIVAVVEPFVDLALRDVRATVVADALRVSGILVNYGSAPAYRVGARACLSDGRCAESFVGDVESGAQRAFSVSVSTTSPLDEIKLTIYYYNIYNELQYVETSVPVMVAATPTPTTTPIEHQFTTERWVVVAAVAAFLVGAAYLLYKVVSSYNRKLKTISKVPPP